MSHPPQIDKILRESILAPWFDCIQGSIITQIVRDLIKEKNGQTSSASEIAQQAALALEEILQDRLKPVINGTGIIINTNLGRAPLSSTILSSAMTTLNSYCDLEFNLDDGKRGERLDYLEKLFRLITGCESAIVVNNNAAAVMLLIATFATNKEVIVSRGELVEIGGSFRLPDVIAAAGGQLKEIGTTNRTRIKDYEKAISANTGLIFKCHRSNFEMTGFVEETTLSELKTLSKAKKIMLVEDLGSGALVSLEKFGLKHERTVQESLKDGVDLVTFSGDKLFGGPQAGIILGGKEKIALLRQHPMYRALRADKMLIVLLETVLKEYLSPSPEKYLPVLAMTSESTESIGERVKKFIAQANCPELELKAMSTESALGGGTTPGLVQASFGISLKAKKISPQQLTKKLREASPPVIARLQNEQVIIDFRTIPKHEEATLLQSLQSLAIRG